MLTNSAPVNTNTVKANLTEISAGNGYTAGGQSLVLAVNGITDDAIILDRGAVVWSGPSTALEADPAILEQHLGVGARAFPSRILT